MFCRNRSEICMERHMPAIQQLHVRLRLPMKGMRSHGRSPFWFLIGMMFMAPAFKYLLPAATGSPKPIWRRRRSQELRRS